MSPSIYVGCQIEDDISESLKTIRGTFQSYQQDTDAILAGLQTSLNQLSGTKTHASAVAGVAATDQVLWTALEEGLAGNNIQVMYRNLGPIWTGAVPFLPRPTSAEVVGRTVYVTLAILGGDPSVSPDVGKVDPAQTVAICLPIWLSDPDVAALVTAELVGDGSGVPSVTSMIPLSGGEGAPLKDAELAADDISKVFGYDTYQSFMKSLSVPVIESEADAAKYLESVDDEYVIVNKKLFLVSGTNLVGLRQLYQAVQKDLPLFKQLLTAFAGNILIPHVVYVENKETTDYTAVCNALVPIVTVTSKYVSADISLAKAAEQTSSRSISALSSFIFWIKETNQSVQSYNKLKVWGFPDEYITSILLGETPEAANEQDVLPPVVVLIEDPTLFQLFGFTDAEIVEILEKDVLGIKPPSQDDQQDKASAVNKLMRNDRKTLDNGMKSKAKKPFVALQAVDFSATMNDNDLSKELATRGKACARMPSKFSVGNYSPPELPSLDLPNMPSASLPDASKKIESAFAALSSAISSASKLFDAQVDGLLKTCKSALNKIQNLLSMAENLFNNDLVKCLLGTSSPTTGDISLPSPGGGSGGVSPLGNLPGTGGLPIPMSLFATAMKELSTALDKAITSAFEGLMKLIEYPLCMVKSLLSSIMGFDLGGLTNPCAAGKNPADKCPNHDVQDIINNSTDMLNVMTNLPHMNNFSMQEEVTTVTESVQEFSGNVVESATTTYEEITRGINEVVDDLMKSLDAKMQVVNSLYDSIKAMISDSAEVSTFSEENEKNKGGCNPPSLGFFTDSIMAYV